MSAVLTMNKPCDFNEELMGKLHLSKLSSFHLCAQVCLLKQNWSPIYYANTSGTVHHVTMNTMTTML